MKRIFIKSTLKRKINQTQFKKDLLRLLDLLRLNNVELSLFIIGNRLMRRLNRTYRGIDRTTDVLSFPQFDGKPGKSIHGVSALGDIVINLDKVKLQAQKNNVSFLKETRFILIHGLLHLLGYDHERGRVERLKMEKLQMRLLNALEKLDNKR